MRVGVSLGCAGESRAPFAAGSRFPDDSPFREELAHGRPNDWGHSVFLRFGAKMMTKDGTEKECSPQVFDAFKNTEPDRPFYSLVLACLVIGRRRCRFEYDGNFTAGRMRLARNAIPDQNLIGAMGI